MTNYSFNQAVYMDKPEMSAEEIFSQALPLIKSYDLEQQARFYMLLCKDANYYTVFEVSDSTEESEFASEVIECFKEVGTGEILDVLKTEDGSALELWTKIQGYDPDKPVEVRTAPVVAYLFNYDRGVVKCGRR